MGYLINTNGHFDFENPLKNDEIFEIISSFSECTVKKPCKNTLKTGDSPWILSDDLRSVVFNCDSREDCEEWLVIINDWLNTKGNRLLPKTVHFSSEEVGEVWSVSVNYDGSVSSKNLSGKPKNKLSVTPENIRFLQKFFNF